MRVLAYWFFVLAAFSAGVLHSHIPLSAMYGPSNFFFVFVPLPALLVSRFGFSGTRAFLGRMLRQELLPEDFRVFDMLNACALLLGGLGTIVGMIHVMRNLLNPDAVGPGVAFAFVSMIYGAVVPVLLLPFHNAFTARRLVKRAAVFAFFVVPGCMGATMFSLHMMKVL